MKKIVKMKNFKKNIFLNFLIPFFFFSGFILLFLFNPSLLLAVPPPPGFKQPIQNPCKVNPIAIKKNFQRIKAAPFFPLPLSPTTSYIAVIRVDFSDKSMTKSKAETEQFFESLKNFYLENSYGILTVSATVTNRISGGSAGAQGAYRLPSSLASYAQGICSNFSDLAKDALSAADTDLNFADARTDLAGNQSYSHVMIYHAGIGAETANDSGCQTDNIWSVFAPTVAASAAVTEGIRVPFAADGISFNGATVVPENEAQNIEPLGVICHEYGHQLGLPDLYQTSAKAVVGQWSLMDSGVYIGSPKGSNPAHLDAWSKQFLGFFSNPNTITPTESPMTFPLDFALSSGNAFVKIAISGVSGVDSSKEYFLIERRAAASLTKKIYDDSLPFGIQKEGYLIWHIDDSIAADSSRLEANNINNGSPNLGVDLVEAAGGGAIALTSGKESDPFPGSEGNTLFAAPHSNAFNGQQSGIVVTGFTSSQLTAKKAFATTDVEVTKTINFPNPGGPNYLQKSGAPAKTVTTIVLNLTRSAKKIELALYDITGILIKEVPQSSIKANGSATQTNKFVYEYDWDGTNGENESVASGVYLYRFKIDDSIVKTGKLVLIR